MSQSWDDGKGRVHIAPVHVPCCLFCEARHQRRADGIARRRARVLAVLAALSRLRPSRADIAGLTLAAVVTGLAAIHLTFPNGGHF